MEDHESKQDKTLLNEAEGEIIQPVMAGDSVTASEDLHETQIKSEPLNHIDQMEGQLNYDNSGTKLEAPSLENAKNLLKKTGVNLSGNTFVGLDLAIHSCKVTNSNVIRETHIKKEPGHDLNQPEDIQSNEDKIPDRIKEMASTSVRFNYFSDVQRYCGPLEQANHISPLDKNLDKEMASTSVHHFNYFSDAQQYFSPFDQLKRLSSVDNYIEVQKDIASTSMQYFGYNDDTRWNSHPLDLSYKSILDPSCEKYNLAVTQNQPCTYRKRARWFYCHHCGHKSKSRNNLKLHIISIHLGKKPFQCELCNYGTNRIVYLKDHINSVHYNMKPFQCPECDYRASTKGNLNQHINSIHVGEKPFQCPYCSSRMSQRSKLNQHIKSVHNGEKPHQCPHCEYRASQKSSLNLHIKHIHQGERPFECPQCDHRTTTKSKLNLHINSVHVKVKPFQCPLCDHKTSEKNKLNQHFNSVHKGENLFQCPYCETRMNQQRHLFRHINSVHKEEQLQCALSMGVTPQAHNL